MTANGTGTLRVNDAQPRRTCARIRWLRRVSPLILVLLAFGLYMWRADAKGIWWDESLSLYRAQRTVPHILSNRIDYLGSSTIDQHPPLYFLLLHAFTRLCGESDMVLRFPSALFATLIVPLLYDMGIRLRNRNTGLLAALFGALSPLYLHYAQEARMYTMVTALGLASVYFLWRAFTEQKWVLGVAAALAACAAATTQYLFVLLIPCEALLVFFLWPRQEPLPLATEENGCRRRHRAALFGAAAISMLLLSVVVYRVARLVWSLRAGYRYVSPITITHNALNSFGLGLSASLSHIWVLDLLFATVFVGGVIAAWRRPPSIGSDTTKGSLIYRRGAGLVIVLAYALLPIACIWIVSMFIPFYASKRYLMVASPAFYLGLGLGLEALTQWKPWPATLLVTMLTLGMGFSIIRYFFDGRYQAKEDYRSAAQFILANERIGDAIIVSGPESMTAFMHYYSGDLPVFGMPRSNANPDQIAEEMADLGRSYDRLWLARCPPIHSDPDNLVPEWLGTHALLLGRKNFPGYAYHVTVSTHLPRYPVLGPRATWPEPIGGFGQCLSLLDYTIRYASVAGEPRRITFHEATRIPDPSPEVAGVAPGKTVSVEFIWNTLCEMDAYKTSLRLVDSRGLMWTQRDREPFMYLPTSEWPVGATVRHEADVRIPPGTPPGVFGLRLVVYEKESGRPLSWEETGAPQDDPWLELGQVVVAPAQYDWPERAFLPEAVNRPWPRAFFDSRLELMGHVLAPHTLQAGENLELQLYWRARRAIDQDCDLVLNWVDATGKVWHTSTHSPTGRDYPTSRWRKGEMVRGLLRIRVPPDAPQGVHGVHLLVHQRDEQRFLWLGRGWLPWSGHDLEIATVTIE